MNNVIVLRSVYGKVGNTYYIQPNPNPKTLRYPECVKRVDKEGKMQLSQQEIEDQSKGLKYFIPENETFEIVDGTTFDLDDVIDSAKWESIKYCDWIAKDRFERNAEGELVIDGNQRKYGKADLYVERPGEITKIRLTKKQLIHRASSYVYDDSESERIKKCKVLGRNLTNAMPSDILDYLIDKAEKDPKKVISMYEDEDWKLQLFIIEAIERGVIRKSGGLFLYDEKSLGGSMESVIILLKDPRYKAILNSLKRETYPELMTKEQISEIQNDITKGIPHFDEPTEPETKDSSKPVFDNFTDKKNKLTKTKTTTKK